MEECTDGFCPMPTATTVDHNLHFFDPVEKPVHYAAGSVECIDAIEAQMTPEERRSAENSAERAAKEDAEVREGAAQDDAAGGGEGDQQS